MKLIFLYGGVATGKLTVARELAALTGYAVFHNHLIVDAVASIFPFGSERFVRLREQFWLTMFSEAAEAGRSAIFTFAPEASVAADFPERTKCQIEAAGGETHFVRLTIPVAEQERRIGNPDRAAFGKLRSLALLRQLRQRFAECDAAMPTPALTIDTALLQPAAAAHAIISRLGLTPDPPWLPQE
jgi:hypothetical protein